MCFHSKGVWSNKFVSARNVQATLCRVLSISFVETQNSRTALRGFVQILLGRSAWWWLFSGFLAGGSGWTSSCSRCSSASCSSWVGASAGGGGRLRSASVSVLSSSRLNMLLWFVVRTYDSGILFGHHFIDTFILQACSQLVGMVAMEWWWELWYKYF